MIDWTNVEAAAEKAANNHSKFESFAWFGEPEDSEKWMLHTISHRDSTLLEESNADAIEKAMKEFDDDCHIEKHNHWAVGYVNTLVIRVYAKRGKKKITKAFRKFCEIQDALQDYAVLDETDYSNRQYEAAIQNIKSEGGIEEAEAKAVFSWLWDNDQSEVEDTDDLGAYPSSDAIQAALDAIRGSDEEQPLDRRQSLQSIQAEGTPLLDNLERES